jgi:hypothetical protein
LDNPEKAHNIITKKAGWCSCIRERKSKNKVKKNLKKEKKIENENVRLNFLGVYVRLYRYVYTHTAIKIGQPDLMALYGLHTVIGLDGPFQNEWKKKKKK